MMHGWSHWGRGFMGFRGGSIVMMILWLVVIVGVIVFLVKQFGNNSTNNKQIRNYSSHSNQEETPLEIAKKRYAKGEIDKEELEEIKTELRD